MLKFGFSEKATKFEKFLVVLLTRASCSVRATVQCTCQKVNEDFFNHFYYSISIRNSNFSDWEEKQNVFKLLRPCLTFKFRLLKGLSKFYCPRWIFFRLSYSNEGCYVYLSGSYKGLALYGTGGTVAQMQLPISELRPRGYDCN